MNKLKNIEDIWNNIEKNSFDDIRNLIRNSILLDSLLDTNFISFKELINKFKNIKDGSEFTGLWCLFYDGKEWFENLLKNNKINKDDLKYLLNKLTTWAEISAFDKIPLIWNYIIKQNIIDKKLFKELVDKFTNIKDYNDYSYFGRIVTKNMYI